MGLGWGVEVGSRARALTAGELAWIAALPVAAVVFVAIVALGPPLGRALFTPGPQDALWPAGFRYVFGGAEPVKHGRFAIALLGPFLLAASVLVAGRRPIRMRARTARGLTALSQVLAVAFVAIAVLGQHSILFHEPAGLWPVFDAGELAVALALLLASLLALRHAAVSRRIARCAAETRSRAIACLAVAGLVTACWLLLALDTEGTIGLAGFRDLPPWAMADTFAILDGRTPLVDSFPLYGELWAYVAAAPMAVLGPTIAVFSVVMTSITALALLALYAVFRRVVRSSLLALALYLPTLAIGFLLLPAPLDATQSNVQVFSVWPMRYAGPYLVAWLTARHLGGDAPRRRWLLFLAAGLAAVNNLDFGLGALAATLAAVICARPPRDRRDAARMARALAAGLAGAVLLLVLLTFVRAGRLPHPAAMLEFVRVFGVTGLVSMPMPSVGLHLALYATFAGAIGLAAARLLSGERDPLLTGMLAWSGVFGLFAGGYFAGRSDVWKLVALFSAWSFALGLLVVAVARELSARGWRRPRLVELLVLYGFALVIGSLHELPAPWSQIARLQRTTEVPLYAGTDAAAFIRERTRRHEHVAILAAMGHRIAYRLELANVSPYPLIEAIATRRQWDVLLDALRAESAHKLFVPDELLAPQQQARLAGAGFSRRAGGGGLSEWSDAPSGSR